MRVKRIMLRSKPISLRFPYMSRKTQFLEMILSLTTVSEIVEEEVLFQQFMV